MVFNVQEQLHLKVCWKQTLLPIAQSVAENWEQPFTYVWCGSNKLKVDIQWLGGDVGGSLSFNNFLCKGKLRPWRYLLRLGLFLKVTQIPLLHCLPHISIHFLVPWRMPPRTGGSPIYWHGRVNVDPFRQIYLLLHLKVCKRNRG